jgi:hypothetical protein
MSDGPLIVQSDKTVLLEVDHELAGAARADVRVHSASAATQRSLDVSGMEITVRLAGCRAPFWRFTPSVECGGVHRKQSSGCTVTELSL